MNMTWVPTFLVYLGTIDAILVLTTGFVFAALVLFGRDVDKLAARIGPAAGILIGTNIAGGLILLATRWAVG